MVVTVATKLSRECLRASDTGRWLQHGKSSQGIAESSKTLKIDSLTALFFMGRKYNCGINKRILKVSKIDHH